MVLDLVAADAEALDCSDQVEDSRTVVSDGTSAENEHEGTEIALKEVSRWIRDATLAA